MSMWGWVCVHSRQAHLCDSWLEADLAGEKHREPAKALVGKLQKVVSQGEWPLSTVQQDGVVDGGRARLEGREIIKNPLNDDC